MEGSLQLPASTSSALAGAELPYQGYDLSALVLMPPLGQLAVFERQLTPAGLARVVAGLRPRSVDLHMPRFSVTSALTLTQVLSAMGMGQAFANSADFSNLSPNPLKLSFVVQDAQMKVNENGTEASAASAAGVTPTAVRRPQPALNLFFDHPFLFLVRDDSTGLIIFATQVNNPAP
jgi:serpin B